MGQLFLNSSQIMKLLIQKSSLNVLNKIGTAIHEAKKKKKLFFPNCYNETSYSSNLVK